MDTPHQTTTSRSSLAHEEDTTEAEAVEADCGITAATAHDAEAGTAARLRVWNNHPQQPPPPPQHHHHHDASYDTHLLKRAVADAGRWAYGIILVEVWAVSDDGTYLYRPEAGWWIDPVYHSRCSSNVHESESSSSCPICRLVDPQRHDYVPPRHLCPNEGLPGVLWSQVCASSESQAFRESSASASFFAATTMAATATSINNSSSNINIYHHHHHHRHTIAWRSVPQLCDDPDQPWNPRLQLLASIGLGWAAAVPLRCWHDPLHPHQGGSRSRELGIVIYMARDGVDRTRLQSPVNEAYLGSASDLIAAAFVLRGPRHQIIHQRRMELKNSIIRLRTKILSILRSGQTLQEYIHNRKESAVGGNNLDHPVNNEEEALRCPSYWKYPITTFLSNRIRMSVKKSIGGGAPVPPSFTWSQTTFTFVGSFVTLLVIISMSDRLVAVNGPEYRIVLGPFGAFMTLLYGLTAAPASQPWNAMLGQLISMCIALSFTYADESILPLYIRQSLAVSLSIACMVKLGVIHPPAGASALLLSVGTGTQNDDQNNSPVNGPSLGWINAGMSLVATFVAIVVATFVNNLSRHRQYPLYWGWAHAQRNVVSALHHVFTVTAADTTPPMIPRLFRLCSIQRRQQRRRTRPSTEYS